MLLSPSFSPSAASGEVQPSEEEKKVEEQNKSETSDGGIRDEPHCGGARQGYVREHRNQKIVFFLFSFGISASLLTVSSRNKWFHQVLSNAIAQVIQQQEEQSPLLPPPEPCAKFP